MKPTIQELDRGQLDLMWSFLQMGRQRANNNKWDAENMKVLGCKMRRDRAEAFQALCKIKGTTPNAVFQAAAEAFLAEHGGRIGDSCGGGRDGAQGGEGQEQSGQESRDT